MYVSNARAEKYLQSFLKVIENFNENIDSIILFGSHARNEASILSDIDLLIVTKTDNKKIKDLISGKLRALEQLFDYVKPPVNLMDYLLLYINIATGMFKSWFICSKKDLEQLNFSKITGTNLFLGKLFAPSKLILKNIRKDGIVIFGEKDCLLSIPKMDKIEPQIIKSFLLNEVLSVSALIISPFTKRSILYSLESIKWSLFIIEKKTINGLLTDSYMYKKLQFYNFIKNTGKLNKRLIIITPYLIYKIHVKAITERKQNNKK